MYHLLERGSAVATIAGNLLALSGTFGNNVTLVGALFTTLNIVFISAIFFTHIREKRSKGGKSSENSSESIGGGEFTNDGVSPGNVVISPLRDKEIEMTDKKESSSTGPVDILHEDWVSSLAMLASASTEQERAALLQQLPFLQSKIEYEIKKSILEACSSKRYTLQSVQSAVHEFDSILEKMEVSLAPLEAKMTIPRTREIVTDAELPDFFLKDERNGSNYAAFLKLKKIIEGGCEDASITLEFLDRTSKLQGSDLENFGFNQAVKMCGGKERCVDIVFEARNANVMLHVLTPKEIFDFSGFSDLKREEHIEVSAGCRQNEHTSHVYDATNSLVLFLIAQYWRFDEVFLNDLVLSYVKHHRGSNPLFDSSIKSLLGGKDKYTEVALRGMLDEGQFEGSKAVLIYQAEADVKKSGPETVLKAAIRKKRLWLIFIIANLVPKWKKLFEKLDKKESQNIRELFWGNRKNYEDIKIALRFTTCARLVETDNFLADRFGISTISPHKLPWMKTLNDGTVKEEIRGRIWRFCWYPFVKLFRFLKGILEPIIMNL